MTIEQFLNTMKETSLKKVLRHKYILWSKNVWHLCHVLQVTLQDARAKIIEVIVVRLKAGFTKPYKSDSLREVFNKSKGKPK